MKLTRVCLGVNQDKVYYKGTGLGGNSSVGQDYDASSVEDQTVIAADLIDVDHGPAVRLCECAQHVQTQGPLMDRVGRAGNIDDHRGAFGNQFSDRIAFIERFRPECFIVPDIFTDGDAQVLVAEGEDILSRGRLKISG